VAQQRAIAAGEHGGHAAAKIPDARLPGRVHTAVDAVQAAALELALDRADAEPLLEQLRARDHAVLPRGTLAHVPPD
jgi:hypothetical protein